MIAACRFKVHNFCSGAVVEWTVEYGDGPAVQIRQGKKLVCSSAEIADELEALAQWVRGAE